MCIARTCCLDEVGPWSLTSSLQKDLFPSTVLLVSYVGILHYTSASSSPRTDPKQAQIRVCSGLPLRLRWNEWVYYRIPLIPGTPFTPQGIFTGLRGRTCNAGALEEPHPDSDEACELRFFVVDYIWLYSSYKALYPKGGKSY